MSTNNQYSTHGRLSATGSQPNSDIPAVAAAERMYLQLSSPPEEHITKTQFTKLFLAV